MRKYVHRPPPQSHHTRYAAYFWLEFRFLQILDEKKIARGIIIYAEKMTPSAKKVRLPSLLRIYYRMAELDDSTCRPFFFPFVPLYVGYHRHVPALHSRRVRRSESACQHHSPYSRSTPRSPVTPGEKSAIGEIVRLFSFILSSSAVTSLVLTVICGV